MSSLASGKIIFFISVNGFYEKNVIIIDMFPCFYTDSHNFERIDQDNLIYFGI